jgi:hypothetical protein
MFTYYKHTLIKVFAMLQGLSVDPLKGGSRLTLCPIYHCIKALDGCRLMIQILCGYILAPRGVTRHQIHGLKPEDISLDAFLPETAVTE